MMLVVVAVAVVVLVQLLLLLLLLLLVVNCSFHASLIAADALRLHCHFVIALVYANCKQVFKNCFLVNKVADGLAGAPLAPVASAFSFVTQQSRHMWVQ